MKRKIITISALVLVLSLLGMTTLISAQNSSRMISEYGYNEHTLRGQCAEHGSYEIPLFIPKNVVMFSAQYSLITVDTSGMDFHERREAIMYNSNTAAELSEYFGVPFDTSRRSDSNLCPHCYDNDLCPETGAYFLSNSIRRLQERRD